MTADGYDPLYDQLEQILSARAAGDRERLDTVGAAARILYTLSRWSPPGEVIKPTTAKQADQTAELCDRLEQMLSAPDVERCRDGVKDVVDFLFSVSWTLPGEYVNPTTRKQAERDLLALRKQAGEFRSLISRMNKTALDAMGFDKIHIGQLVQMEEDAQRVLERLRARPGGPRKSRADWVTLIAASVFSRLTGVLPTVCTDLEGRAYGPFVELLKEVFKACGIAASAEARAKDFISKFCRPRRELEMRQ